MLLPTRTGLGLLLLCFFLYLASMQATTGLLYLVLGILFGCFVVNLVGSAAALRRLRIVPPVRLTGTEGGRLDGTWLVVNEGNSPSGLCEVRDRSGVLARIGVIAAEETRAVGSSSTAGKRGVYPMSRLVVRCSWPFGLIASQGRCEGQGDIVVFPRVYTCESPAASGFEPMLGGRFKGQHFSSAGDDFHGVRPMEARDPMRAIHWPSSSKGRGMMVKQFSQELAGRVAIVILAGPEIAANGESALDCAARAAASLALAALDAGHQVELVDVFGGRVISVPPFADSEVVLGFCAFLTAAEVVPGGALVDRQAARMPRKAAICYIATAVPAGFENWLLTGPLAGRRQSLYLPMPAEEEAAIDVAISVGYYSHDAVYAP